MIEKLGVRQVDNWQFFLIGGLLLLVLLTWIELLRQDKTQRMTRVIAIVLAITSLVLLALKPFYIKENTDDLTILLTNGSTKRDSLMLAHPNARFIEWSDTVQSSHLSPNVIVDGYGIPEYDLWKVGNRSISFIKPLAPSGVIDISYLNEVNEGEKIEISVKTNGIAGHKLVLQGLGEKYDSAVIGEGLDMVKLSCKLKAVGMYVLTLSQFDATDQLINAESIPVIINPAKKFDVLLINAFPTFESRFLKQFLEASGHNYFIRSQISTDKYRYESNGTNVNEMSRLTEAGLKPFDAIIINAAQLIALPRNQQQALANAVQNYGLGILVVASDGELVNKLPQWAYSNYKKAKNELFILSSNNNELEVGTSPYRFVPSVLSEVVYADDDGSIVQSKPYGLGKVVLSSFISTYELSLAGYEDAYQNLWKKLIESCLRPQAEYWSIPTEHNYVHRPMKFELRSDTLSRVVYGTDDIPLKQNLFVGDKWVSDVWPNNEGWNYVDINGQSGDRKYFYVHKPIAFESIQMEKRVEANSRLANESNMEETSPINSKEDISLWWFYIIFTISMAYLWLQPKFR
ncbi:hypothetical protein [Fulvivirga lutimaris]|uniref:hypothetical protein n=1 Tax=Fulvivirga lutimaris TaxID=1819566 RepID=UPI0012BC9DB4|nr:hypothetical protein [Fulvivirga lutimaris]MTI39502.1 hypothetical protein [Fulvivirga lutimaris]